jgi:hypothetical protein
MQHEAERAMTRPPRRIVRTITYRVDCRDPDWREVARFDDMGQAIQHARSLATQNPTRIVSEHMLADFTHKNGKIAVEWHAVARDDDMAR